MIGVQVLFVALFLFGLAQPLAIITAVNDDTSPVPPNEPPKLARYIMRNSRWLSIATNSIQSGIKGYPFVSLKSVSEGTNSKSTGIPYLYMTDMDVSGADLVKDNRCTIMASLAQSDFVNCTEPSFDPQDPRCPKVMITGRMLKIDKNSDEYNFGQDALFWRHPSMKHWPPGHGFYVAKVNVEQVEVLGAFGGIQNVSVDDYFNPKNSPISSDWSRLVILNRIDNSYYYQDFM